jgi:hypothetical protein
LAPLPPSSSPTWISLFSIDSSHRQPHCMYPSFAHYILCISLFTLSLRKPQSFFHLILSCSVFISPSRLKNVLLRFCLIKKSSTDTQKPHSPYLPTPLLHPTQLQLQSPAELHLRSTMSELPRPLAALLERAWAHAPEKRPSAADVVVGARGSWYKLAMCMTVGIRTSKWRTLVLAAFTYSVSLVHFGR